MPLKIVDKNHQVERVARLAALVGRPVPGTLDEAISNAAEEFAISGCRNLEPIMAAHIENFLQGRFARVFTESACHPAVRQAVVEIRQAVLGGAA